MNRYDVLTEIRKDPRASLRELAVRLGLSPKSQSVVSYHIERLIEEGLIRKERYLSRSLEVCSPSTALRAKIIDQRKRSSPAANAKKAKAGKQGRGMSATIAKGRTERKLKEAELIEMVVRLAELEREIGNSKDFMKDQPRRLWRNLNAVKIG